MVKNKIQVEVAYGTPDLQKIETVEVEEGTSVLETIIVSSLIKSFPEINLGSLSVGIFGKKCQLNDVVSRGDRIEIYRPLLIDPKQARRHKASLRNRKFYPSNQ